MLAPAPLFLLAVLACMQDAAPPPATDASSPSSEAAPAAPRDVVGIARREAARERARVEERVKAIVADLRKSTDATLGFIAARQAELAGLGAAGLPFALATMDHPESDPGAINAGRNAAAAIARLDAPGTREALEDLARKGGPNGKRNALRALAMRGDPASLPVFEQALAAAETDAGVLVEAIPGVAQLGGPAAEAAIRPFVARAEPDVAVAAIVALAMLPGRASGAAVLARVQEELAKTEAPNDAVVLAGLAFWNALPDPAALPVLEGLLRGRNGSYQMQMPAARALAALARQNPELKKPVLDVLKAALADASPLAVRDVAKAMNDLGDDSGLAVVTADLDRQIDRQPNNVVPRLQRAQIFLDFARWRDANKDLREVLRHDKNQVDAEQLNLGLARSYAGMGKFADAARHLGRLVRTAGGDLLRQYPEFGEMAGDSRYEKHFAANGKS